MAPNKEEKLKKITATTKNIDKEEIRSINISNKNKFSYNNSCKENKISTTSNNNNERVSNNNRKDKYNTTIRNNKQGVSIRKNGNDPNSKNIIENSKDAFIVFFIDDIKEE